jgi:hypothetical protein
MEINFLVFFVAAFVPLVVGFIWYGPLFGNAWMNQMGFTKESLKEANMTFTFLLSYAFSFLIAMTLQAIVVHQMGVYSTLAGEPDFMEETGAAFTYFQDFMTLYGNRFRTFKHGVLHGALVGVFLVLPILGIQAMFERKKVKYVAINAGYWILTLALMGGIVCYWA